VISTPRQWCEKKGIDFRLYTAWRSVRQTEHCDRWSSFSAFSDDVGQHPGKEYLLARRDRTAPHSKDNSRWILRIDHTTRLTHGEGHSRGPSLRFTAWAQMVQRCGNPNASSYGIYGACGVVVCKRWRSFENFAADMGEHPGRGWGLELKDKRKNYSKSNCRWSLSSILRRRRMTTKLSEENVRDLRQRPRTYHGCQKDWAKEFNISEARVSQILSDKKGWVGV
jgi:hypothetical protein